MHIIHHIEARELRFRLPLAQSALASLLKTRFDAFAEAVSADGFPLVAYSGGEKSASSLVTKLLVKKEHHAATIHDRVRFRFVVKDQLDVVSLLSLMTKRLFPYNYVAPGQTVNLLVNFTALVESHTAYRPHAHELQLEYGAEEAKVQTLNEFSGPSFRVVSVVVDVPLRIPDAQLPPAADREGLGRVIFGLAEIQIVDEKADHQNEHGENRHDRYRQRQLLVVRDRLERGKRGSRDDELSD